MVTMCRHCGTEITQTFLDLGSAPPSNAYLTKEKLLAPEKWYPLKVVVCHKCWLVQTVDFTEASDLFDEDYAYFSSVSDSWVEHAKKYCGTMIDRLSLNENSFVLEVACNDGYLLQFFKEAGIKNLGVEPTKSTANEAENKGIDVVSEFFGLELSNKLVLEKGQADLVVCNNVLAHVPDINDFSKAVANILKKQGVATFEFPHLLNLVQQKQFDTIYHEHFSYLSLVAVKNVFDTAGLEIFNVEELPTHGGSLRLYAQRKDSSSRQVAPTVANLLEKEIKSGVENLEFYQSFSETINHLRIRVVEFLNECSKEGKSIAAYGAAAKGNTLLNYLGIRSQSISFVVDRSPGKLGKYLPGSRIPIVDEEHLRKSKPQFLVLLPWNIKDELVDQLSYVFEWNCKLVTFIPDFQLIEG